MDTNCYFIKVEPDVQGSEPPLNLEGDIAPPQDTFKVDIDEMGIEQLKCKHETEDMGNMEYTCLSHREKTKEEACTSSKLSLQKMLNRQCKAYGTKSKSSELRDFTLLQCPACDKTFTGGKSRVPHLLDHVNESHYKQRKRLISGITEFWL